MIQERINSTRIDPGILVFGEREREKMDVGGNCGRDPHSQNHGCRNGRIYFISGRIDPV